MTDSVIKLSGNSTACPWIPTACPWIPSGFHENVCPPETMSRDNEVFPEHSWLVACVRGCQAEKWLHIHENVHMIYIWRQCGMMCPALTQIVPYDAQTLTKIGNGCLPLSEQSWFMARLSVFNDHGAHACALHPAEQSPIACDVNVPINFIKPGGCGQNLWYSLMMTDNHSGSLRLWQQTTIFHPSFDLYLAEKELCDANIHLARFM